MLLVDGMVGPKDYEIACENSRKFKDIFIGLAKDDASVAEFANMQRSMLDELAGHIKDLRNNCLNGLTELCEVNYFMSLHLVSSSELVLVLVLLDYGNVSGWCYFCFVNE